MMFSSRSDEKLDSTHHAYTQKGQALYLVFESSLLLLFSLCSHCNSHASVRKVVIGSFLRIIQTCSTCSRRRTWESQPYIGNTPAGNILTSAAILYSGTLPSKAFKMFQVLNLCMMSRKTFFRHQRKYLQPAVSRVWKRSQELLLTALKDKGSSLVLGGDGRSDSPGHSAKYGSYSVLELTCNKIVDFKLVQVSNFLVCMFSIAATMHVPSFVHRAMRLVAATIWRKKVLIVCWSF